MYVINSVLHHHVAYGSNVEPCLATPIRNDLGTFEYDVGFYLTTITATVPLFSTTIVRHVYAVCTLCKLEDTGNRSYTYSIVI
jgi:hypothetical protein